MLHFVCYALTACLFKEWAWSNPTTKMELNIYSIIASTGQSIYENVKDFLLFAVPQSFSIIKA